MAEKKCPICGTIVKTRATPIGERESCQQWCSIGKKAKKDMEQATVEQRIEQKTAARARREAAQALRQERREEVTRDG